MIEFDVAGQYMHTATYQGFESLLLRHYRYVYAISKPLYRIWDIAIS
jgi:hypothetical protein